MINWNEYIGSGGGRHFFKVRLKTEGARDAPIRRVVDLTDTCISSLGAIRIFTFPKALAIAGLLNLDNFIEINPFYAQVTDDHRSTYSVLGYPSKITLGAVEDIIFTSLGIKFPARLR